MGWSSLGSAAATRAATTHAAVASVTAAPSAGATAAAGFSDARINAKERHLRWGEQTDAVLGARDDDDALVRA